MKTYAAIYDNEIRSISSSGGVFSLLAEQFDVVYGVGISDDCYFAKMIRVEDRYDCLCGSKYLQAKVGECFRQAKDDLNKGKKVLFSGTGCQINGLKSYIEAEYDNLTCVDVVCHGVPSPALWHNYVLYQEKKHGKLISVSFRCKNKQRLKKNELYISKDKDYYMQMFLRNYSLRPSCYECYAKTHKCSDITIGDFWGIENIVPELNDGMGTSLVITRTDKGQNLFNTICDRLQWKEVSYEDGVMKNKSEYSSSFRPIQRDGFFIDMEKMPFRLLAKKYIEGIYIKKIIRKTYGLLKWRKKEISSNADYGMLLRFTEHR